MSAKPFKLTAPRALESDRQAQIIDWLRIEQAQGRVSWFCRVNGGAVMAGKRFVRFYSLHLKGIAPASKGYADIHGMLPGGRYFALEVKQPGERATPEQRAFLDAVAMGGGIAAVVYGFEDVEKVLREATKNRLAAALGPEWARRVADDGVTAFEYDQPENHAP